MMGEGIHVCYCINDETGNYARMLGTSLYSLLSNTKEHIIVHILHDDTMREENKKRLMEMMASYHAEIFFYNFDSLMPKKIADLLELMPQLKGSNWSTASLYRLLMGELFYGKVARMIYLDCDIIVNLDIRELWEEPLPDSGLAAVSDLAVQMNEDFPLFKDKKVEIAEYFNSGVLLLDIKKYAERFSVTEVLREVKKGRLDCPDQDVLNMYFRGSNILPERYNVFVSLAYALERDVGACIYHYVGDSFSFDMTNPYSKLFFIYFSRTPWCDAEFIGSLGRKAAWAAKSAVLNIANCFAGKKRVVVGARKLEGYLRDLLKLRENEAFIPDDTLVNVELNINYYNECWMFFLNKVDYLSVKTQLETMGLKENVNFVWGNYLLDNIGNADKPIKDSQVFLI